MKTEKVSVRGVIENGSVTDRGSEFVAVTELYASSSFEASSIIGTFYQKLFYFNDIIRTRRKHYVDPISWQKGC